jgi:hypothetical protein
MKVNVFKKSGLSMLRSNLPSILFALLIFALIMFGLWQAEVSSRAEGRRLLEDSIRNAVIRSYASKGQFPDTITYIEDNYGIFIDRTRFVVHYRIHAPNRMPDITVIELS